MYQAFFYFAVLAFCSAAPYGDVNSARSFPFRQDQQSIQQPMIVADVQQQDQTDLVDTLGAGYSFFKKQPIGSRPLAQQKLATNDQQAPITSLDETANQWSDYTRASAFKQLPTQVRPSVSGGFGNQQQDLSLMPKTFVNQDQSAYGSAVAQDQSQGLQSIVQRQPLQVVQQQPLIRNLGNSYGQQVQQPDFQDQQQSQDVQQQQPSQSIQQQRPFQSWQQQQQPFQSIQPLIRNLGNSYGQQVQQPDSQDQQQSQDVQQQQPSQSIQLQRPLQSWQQQPLPSFPQQPFQGIQRNLGSSYGQQVQPDAQDQQQSQDVQQQQSLPDVQQQQPLPVIQQQRPFQSIQPLIRNLGNSYGQQVQPDAQDQQQSQDVQQQQPLQVIQQQQRPFQSIQPLIRNLGNSYGQQVQPDAQDQQQSQLFQQQQPSQVIQQQRPFQSIQPLIRNLGNSYGQQVQPDAQDQQQSQDVQQQQSLPDVQQQRPIQSWQQQQQPFQSIQPLIRNLGNSYGQQVQQPDFQDQQQSQDVQQQQPSQSIQQQRPFQSWQQQQPSQGIQPLIRNLGNSYGQQVQPDAQDQQQSQDVQQQQPFQGLQQQQPSQGLQPLIRNLGNSNGQQDTQPAWAVRSNNDLINNGAFGQKLQQRFVIPTVKTVFTQQQQQPAISSVQISQPSWSLQQTQLPRSNSAVISSSRFASQSQPTGQMSDSSSFGGW
jgi:hypothetical protein